MTPELLAHLKREEGFVGHVYKDVAGVATVGYGHALKPGEDFAGGVTESEAVALLVKDAEHAESIAVGLSPGLIIEPPLRLAAITDFIYNLGGGAYGGSVLRLRVNEGKWQEAAEQMKRWVYATNAKTGRKEVMPGLVRRRAVCARWLTHPTDSALPPAA